MFFMHHPNTPTPSQIIIRNTFLAIWIGSLPSPSLETFALVILYSCKCISLCFHCCLHRRHVATPLPLADHTHTHTHPYKCISNWLLDQITSFLPLRPPHPTPTPPSTQNKKLCSIDRCRRVYIRPLLEYSIAPWISWRRSIILWCRKFVCGLSVELNTSRTFAVIYIEYELRDNFTTNLLVHTSLIFDTTVWTCNQRSSARPTTLNGFGPFGAKQ